MTTPFLRSDPAMYTSPRRTYARVGIRDPAHMYTYVAVFSFLHPSRLYYYTCAPLHPPVYMYVQRPGCKKENTDMYVYIRAGSRTPTRAYVWRGLVCMAGWERRNSVVVVFMGRNGMRGRVDREGLDGRGDGNEAWRTTQRRKQTSYGRNGGPVDREGCGVPQNGGNGPPTVETGVLLIGRGVAYRKTEETNLLRSKRGSC